MLLLLKSKEFEIFNSLLESQNYLPKFKSWFEKLCKDTHKVLSNCEKISQDLIHCPTFYVSDDENESWYKNDFLPYDIVWELQVANYFIHGIMLSDNFICSEEIAFNLFECAITGIILCQNFKLSSGQIESLENLGFKKLVVSL